MYTLPIRKFAIAILKLSLKTNLTLRFTIAGVGKPSNGVCNYSYNYLQPIGIKRTKNWDCTVLISEQLHQAIIHYTIRNVPTSENCRTTPYKQNLTYFYAQKLCTRKNKSLEISS